MVAILGSIRNKTHTSLIFSLSLTRHGQDIAFSFSLSLSRHGQERPTPAHLEPASDVGCEVYRGASLIRKRTPLGPFRRPMPRVLGGSWRGGRFLMSEVPLYTNYSNREVYTKFSPEAGPFRDGPHMRDLVLEAVV